VVRVLLVLDDLENPNLRRVVDVFRGIAVSACNQNITLEQIEMHNPNCILSVGYPSANSSLWKMPLWRRRTWLIVPDFDVAPVALRQSLLSLLNATIEPGVFSDTPTITVWNQARMDGPGSIYTWLEGQSYENWQYQSSDAINGGNTGSAFWSSLTHSRDGLIWISNLSVDSLSSVFLEQIVTFWKMRGSSGSVVVANSSDRKTLLDNILSNEELIIRHVLVDSKALSTSRVSTHNLPLKGLIGVVAQILGDPRTSFVTEIDGVSIDRHLLWDSSNDADSTLAQGPVQWAKWSLESVITSHILSTD
jgi:hypothetical protein